MTKTVAAMLTDIPGLAAEALLTWGTNPISDDGRGRRAIPGSRCLADLDRLLVASMVPPRAYGPRLTDPADLALQQRGASVGSLFGWVRVHHDDEVAEGTPTWLPHDDVASVCTWLDVRQEWAQHQEWWDEYGTDVRLLWGSLRAICRIHDAHPWPCLTDGCQGSMRIVDGMLECEHGHRHAGLSRWRHHHSMPLPDVAEQLNVPQRTLRFWVGRGDLGHDAAKGTKPHHIWPWDVIRLRYPDWVEHLETSKETTPV